MDVGTAQADRVTCPRLLLRPPPGPSTQQLLLLQATYRRQLGLRCPWVVGRLAHQRLLPSEVVCEGGGADCRVAAHLQHFRRRDSACDLRCRRCQARSTSPIEQRARPRQDLAIEYCRWHISWSRASTCRVGQLRLAPLSPTRASSSLGGLEERLGQEVRPDELYVETPDRATGWSSSITDRRTSTSVPRRFSPRGPPNMKRKRPLKTSARTTLRLLAALDLEDRSTDLDLLPAITSRSRFRHRDERLRASFRSSTRTPISKPRSTPSKPP